MARSLLFLLLLLLLPMAAWAGSTALSDDVLGLIVFKAEVVDPQSKLATWDEDDDHPCAWFGVTCDPATRRVVALTLDGLSLSGKLGRGLLQLRSLKTLTLARNNFSGELNPDLLSRIDALQTLDLSENRLSGSIPDAFFAQCRSIRSMSLAKNDISGEIPHNVGSCSTLASLDLSSNRLSGSMPSEIWLLNALRSLDLSNNALVGDIPVGIKRMYNLRSISLRGNQLTGSLPDDIGDCLLLTSLDLSSNSLSGNLPDSLRKLSICGYLSLSSNSFTGDVPTWIGELRNLETLDLSGNKFSGQIPSSLGKLELLKELDLSRNSFTGSLPESISACKSLREVDFSSNSLTGTLPSWVFELGLQRILISDNVLSGSIQVPAIAASAARVLDLSGNDFSGVIPAEISDLRGLELLNLSRNSLSGYIPMSVGELKFLEVLDASENRLNGTIPLEIGEVISLKELRLGMNSLTGDIPTQIGNCSSLTSLDLSQNNLTGPIPPTIAELPHLRSVDLSQNKLTGTIPKNLSDLPLISFNISHNLLSGDIPTGTFFNTIPVSSLIDNPGLCGSALNISCPAVLPKPIVLNPNSSSNPLSQPASNPNTLRHRKIKILSISTLIAIAAAAIIAAGVVVITVLNLKVRPSVSNSATAAPFALSDGYLSQSPTTDSSSGKLVMFGGGEAEFSAGTHALLNKDCELGRGGFGAVYQAVLRDGRPVAIKKLTVSSLVKSQDEFEREVSILGNVRHHNLVALKGYYWTSSLQLLIYEFVPGGNLYKHLHECTASNSLSWQERFDIILGIARSLACLHQHNIIHYNLKSSNVLLDDSGEPKVGDYGLAKLLPMLDHYVLSSKVQSALGYMAPEFTCRTVKITDKCDVYGFGVLVLEILSGRRPVEYMEDDVVMLCDLVRGALDEGRAEECIDERLGGKFPIDEAVPVIKLGLICTSRVPSNRPDMTEVVNILELIRCPQDSQEDEIG
ncbi:probable LRR receptor-like serine/threonine-protein kinase IRK [Ananas comosus]|uniref:Probable LRR receptor-like serine/threonine-protein kinase IRK n=1 Tax=Ananas comosus TaxID=4615 RepID=A0A6P5GNX4_ANACO|nr:probable LRR receptor-like serine/threonine-protein kinase IRK [Ananas comosus]